MANAVFERPNVEEIMERIRREVKADAESSKRVSMPFEAGRPQKTDSSFTPLHYSEELNYINAHWQDWVSSEEITTHRRVFGRFIVRAKRFVVDAVFQYLLKGYFERERQYQMHLIRFLNACARHVDDRDYANFWQLVAKVDNDISAVVERMDDLIDKTMATALRFAEELRASKEAQGEEHRQNHLMVRSLADQVRGIETSLGVLAKRAFVAHAPADGASDEADLRAGDEGALRLACDDVSLGDRLFDTDELAEERHQGYAEHFLRAQAPVVHLGCHGGGFLDALRGRGISSIGVTGDSATCALLHDRGIEAVTADCCLTYLQGLKDQSIGGLFSSVLVENMSQKDLRRFFEILSQKLCLGSRVLLESPNPETLSVLSSSSLWSSSGRRLVHPAVLSAFVENYGMRVEKVLYNSPVRSETKLQELEVSSALPPRWQAMLEQLNGNVSRINRLLFAAQRYCLVAVIE